MWARRIVTNILVAIVTVIIVLAVLEVGFRLFAPQPSMAITVNVWDRVMGTRQKPSSTGYRKMPEYEMDLVINSKGLRDREIPYVKTPGTKRILVLGGSYTCGYGVDAEETYPKVLERLLNRDDGREHDWEVINGGVGTTGTAHHLAYFTHEGYKYSSDFLALCFSQDTDFWDSFISGLYTLESGQLVKHDAPMTASRRIQRITHWIPWYNALSARSHLLNFAKRRVARRHHRALAERAIGESKDPTLEQREIDLVRHLLVALEESCAGNDCQLVFVLPPLMNNYDLQPGVAEIIEVLESRGVPVVDLAPAFRNQAGAGTRFYYPRDHHWTKDGHMLVGEALYGFFSEEP